MSISTRLISGMGLLLVLAVTGVLPLNAGDDTEKDRHNQDKDRIVTVLYSGPLVHDQDWTIKSGPRGPDNQKFRVFGGTCSMIPSDVHNISGYEHVTFEAEKLDLGLWKIAKTDTVSGKADDGNIYNYRQRWTYTGPTTDGKAPKPNRATPTDSNVGFLEIVPGNVVADVLDLNDFFVLRTPGGGVVANSNVHWQYRLQIPPAATDPPPSIFPVVFPDFPAKYIVNTHDQLAGQLGCDPL